MILKTKQTRFLTSLFEILNFLGKPVNNDDELDSQPEQESDHENDGDSGDEAENEPVPERHASKQGKLMLIIITV